MKKSALLALAFVLSSCGMRVEIVHSPAQAAAKSTLRGALGGVPGGGFVPPTKVGGGGGDITGVTVTGPISGGASAGNATIGLSPCVSAGQSWVWNGTAFACTGGAVIGPGTSNATTKFSGTNTVTSGWASDDGTSWGVSGKFLITEATGNATGTRIFFSTDAQGSSAGSPRMVNTATSSTVPVFLPNQTSSTTGMGAQAAGNLSLIASGAEAVRVSQGSASVAAVAITSAQAAGGNLGSEILDNTSWTSTGWTGSWSTGWTHTTGNTTALSRTMTNSIGQLYQVAYTVTGRTAGSFTVSVGGSVATSAIIGTGATGPKVLSTNGALVITPTTDFDGAIALSVKLISSTGGIVTVTSNGTAVAQIRGGPTTDTVFVGNAAGQSVTTGNANVGLGEATLRDTTTGTNNTAVGSAVLRSNSTGGDNTAVGQAALNSNTTGNSNVAVGRSALSANTTASSNIAIGSSALANTTTGGTNVAVGGSALNLTTGIQNVGVGHNALTNATTGNDNVSIGFNAGRFLADGSTANSTPGNSTYLGDNTKALSAGDSNETVIGQNAIGAGSNTTTIGNTSVTTTVLQGNIAVDSATGFLWSNSSTDPTTTKDTGIARNAAGVVEINNGTPGSYRDFRARNLLGVGGTVTADVAVQTGGGSGPTWKSGTGSPEGVVTAPVGSIYSRTDGSTGTARYRKETGAGNTGWVADSGTMAGTGTASTIAMFTGTNATGDSPIVYDNSSTITVNKPTYVVSSTGADLPSPQAEIDWFGFNGRWYSGVDTSSATTARDWYLSVGGTYAFRDGATTSGSPTLTSPSGGGFHSIMIGATLAGPGIPGGTTVTAVASPTSLTMSANATATASGQRITVTQARVEDTVYIKHRGALRPTVGIGVTPPDGTYKLQVISPPDEVMGGALVTSRTGNGILGTTNGTGITTDGIAAVYGANNNTYDTTAGSLFAYGVRGDSTATRSGGANTLFNVGLYGNASGGQDNLALFTNSGRVEFAGAVKADSSLSVSGAGHVGGDFDIATSKFNVAAATGNTLVAGTLGVSDVASLGNQLVIGHSGAISYSGLTNTGVGNYNTGSGTLTLAAQNSGGTSTIDLATSNGGNASAQLTVGAAGVTVPGTAHVGGNFDVATTKFTIAAASGDAIGAGALTIAGAATLNGSTTLGDASTDDVIINGSIAGAVYYSGAAASLGTCSGGTIVTNSNGTRGRVTTPDNNCVINLGVTYASIPACTVTVENSSPTAMTLSTEPTTSTLTIHISSKPSGLAYSCDGLRAP